MQERRQWNTISEVLKENQARLLYSVKIYFKDIIDQIKDIIDTFKI